MSPNRYALAVIAGLAIGAVLLGLIVSVKLAIQMYLGV